jgi:hypothetical protein
MVQERFTIAGEEQSAMEECILKFSLSTTFRMIPEICCKLRTNFNDSKFYIGEYIFIQSIRINTDPQGRLDLAKAQRSIVLFEMKNLFMFFIFQLIASAMGASNILKFKKIFPPDYALLCSLALEITTIAFSVVALGIFILYALSYLKINFMCRYLKLLSQ